MKEECFTVWEHDIIFGTKSNFTISQLSLLYNGSLLLSGIVWLVPATPLIQKSRDLELCETKQIRQIWCGCCLKKIKEF